MLFSLLFSPTRAHKRTVGEATPRRPASLSPTPGLAGTLPRLLSPLSVRGQLSTRVSSSPPIEYGLSTEGKVPHGAPLDLTSSGKGEKKRQARRAVLLIAPDEIFKRRASVMPASSTARPWRSPLVCFLAIISVILVLALSWRSGTAVGGAWLRNVRFTLPPKSVASLSPSPFTPPSAAPVRPTASAKPLPLLLPPEEAAAFDPRLAAAAATAASSSSSSTAADVAAAGAAAALPRLQDGLRGALVAAVAGGTPVLLSFASAPASASAEADAGGASSASSSSLSHLEPYLGSLALVGGPELASTAVVACADGEALAACEAAREATAGAGGAEAQCVEWAPSSESRPSSPPSPSWSAVELVAEAVGAGFAVIFASPQSRFAADPRFALRRLAEGRLAEVAVGTKAAAPARPRGRRDQLGLFADRCEVVPGGQGAARGVAGK